MAGLLVGLFHYVATEPVIEQAIVQESMAHPEEAEEAPVVTRDVQRVGGIVGWVFYGLFMGLLFGVVYALARPGFGNAGIVPNALLSVLVAYWLVALLPFLKYPANPPGVGDPETITYRQTLFVLFWVLSIGGVLVAGWAYHVARPRASTATAWAVAAAVYGVYAAGLFLLLPPNPDPVQMPPTLVASFRALSLVGLTLFWIVLGAAFALLLHTLNRANATGAPGAAPSR
jgi:hypothetical protein